VIAPSYSSILSWQANGTNFVTSSKTQGQKSCSFTLPAQSRNLSYPHIHSYPQKKEEKEKSSKKEKEERKGRRLDLSKAPKSIYEDTKVTKKEKQIRKCRSL